MSSASGRVTVVPDADPDFDVRPFLDAVAGLLGGGANVVMQLSWPAIGYGVVESRVESGQVFAHPFKRARTTGTYLAVALLGTEEERAAFRSALDTVHAQVRSTPESPVRYNAFDPRLQLWVAACLFYGGWDYYRRLYGDPGPVVEEAHYRHAARLATTLQVPREMWPPTLEDFWVYWESGCAEAHIDERLRAYLDDILAVRFLPWGLPALMGPAMKWLNTGFLPEPFREQMRLEWSDDDERRLESVLRVLRVVNRLTPGVLRRLPVHVNLWDMRLRRRLGMSLV